MKILLLIFKDMKTISSCCRNYSIDFNTVTPLIREFQFQFATDPEPRSYFALFILRSANPYRMMPSVWINHAKISIDYSKGYVFRGKGYVGDRLKDAMLKVREAFGVTEKEIHLCVFHGPLGSRLEGQQNQT